VDVQVRKLTTGVSSGIRHQLIALSIYIDACLSRDLLGYLEQVNPKVLISGGWRVGGRDVAAWDEQDGMRAFGSGLATAMTMSSR
jgi:hypothetical protein